jgi:genome maintenance exonuclease 1
MSFVHVKIPELDFDLESQTTPEGRKYITPSGKYSSITTVLSSYNKKAFFDWRARVGEEEANRVAAKASRRGTAMHTVCEKYLLNEMTDMKIKTMIPTTKELFRQLRPELDKNIGNVYALEQALYSDRLMVAGRVDCIADWNGVISVIDFKSSSRVKSEEGIQNYFMQCSAYAEMFGERTGKPIEQIVVAIAVENEDLPQIFVRQKYNYLNELKKYIDKHYMVV